MIGWESNQVREFLRITTRILEELEGIRKEFSEANKTEKLEGEHDPGTDCIGTDGKTSE